MRAAMKATKSPDCLDSSLRVQADSLSSSGQWGEPTSEGAEIRTAGFAPTYWICSETALLKRLGPTFPGRAGLEYLLKGAKSEGVAL